MLPAAPLHTFGGGRAPRGTDLRPVCTRLGLLHIPPPLAPLHCRRSSTVHGSWAHLDCGTCHDGLVAGMRCLPSATFMSPTTLADWQSAVAVDPFIGESRRHPSVLLQSALPVITPIMHGAHQRGVVKHARRGHRYDGDRLAYPHTALTSVKSRASPSTAPRHAWEHHRWAWPGNQ